MKKILFIIGIFLLNILSYSQDRMVNSTALQNGCRIISSAPSYYVSNPHTIKIDAWTVQGLLDETATIGWCSSVHPAFPMNFVFELPEEYIFEKAVFNNKCQKEYPGICAKNVKIEVSVTGPNSGFTDAGTFTLSEYNISEHVVNKIKGRWVKLSILSNYGNAEYTELMDFQLMGKYAEPGYDASNIVGMWDTNFEWVSINSNQNGYIYGCYKWSQGELFSGKVDRRVFKFKWSQKLDGQKGWCTVVINKEGTRLSGIWGYNENYSQFGFWDFKKTSNHPYDCWNSKEMQNIKPDYVLRSEPEEKTENKTSLKVQLVDANGNNPIDGKVTFEFDAEKSAVQTSGSYAKLFVNTQSNIKIHAESHGYMPMMQNITLKQGEVNTLVISLAKLEAGKSVTLNNVHFERGKFNMLVESFPELDKIVVMMKDYPTMEIELAGHTDNVGDGQKNVELSENRVKEVKNYLISKGIKTSRIKGVGYGGSKPVASNASEETRKLNRRVEFKILKME